MRVKNGQIVVSWTSILTLTAEVRNVKPTYQRIVGTSDLFHGVEQS